jgi:hypothetical protein
MARANPEDLMVLRLLRQWVFRPATRNGKPITVEMVLILPADRI